jgi:hypothetical protein
MWAAPPCTAAGASGAAAEKITCLPHLEPSKQTRMPPVVRSGQPQIGRPRKAAVALDVNATAGAEQTQKPSDDVGHCCFRIAERKEARASENNA